MAVPTEMAGTESRTGAALDPRRERRAGAARVCLDSGRCATGLLQAAGRDEVAGAMLSGMIPATAKAAVAAAAAVVAEVIAAAAAVEAVAVGWAAAWDASCCAGIEPCGRRGEQEELDLWHS